MGEGAEAAPSGSIRDTLAELAEHQGWVHHVADSQGGEVLSTVLDRPPAPLSRAERLSRLGHPFDPLVFGWPTHRLTPRSPFQASPIAWLSLYKPDIAMPDGEDLAFWSLPREPGAVGADPPGLRSHIGEPPQGHCVVTLSLAGNSWPGQAGRVLVQVFTGSAPPGSIRVPFEQGYSVHTIDVAAVAIPGQPIEVLVTLEPGLHIVYFSALSVSRQLVLDPGRS
jgi:hypothetical protein